MGASKGQQEGLDPRTCPVCGSSYQPYRDSQRACSRRCRDRLPDRAAASRFYRAQPEIRERKNVARRVETDPARSEVNLRQNLRRYGLAIQQYEAMIKAQENRCAICGNQPDPQGVKSASRLHVDHDRKTGAVRSLLCVRCNPGIGYFLDDPAVLRAAADYIERHRKTPT